MALTLSHRQCDMLEAMGIHLPMRLIPRVTPREQMEPALTQQSTTTQRKAPDAAPGAATLAFAPKAIDTAALAHAQWNQAQELLSHCHGCSLRAQCAQPMWGTDALGQTLVQAPAQEYLILLDQAGPSTDELLSPQAYTLLRNILKAARIEPESVFITPVVKCHNTHASAADALPICAVYWQRQRQLLSPKMTLLMGRLSIRAALNTQAPLGQLRERIHLLGGRPAIATYHPEFLLRNPLEKTKAWLDWCLALEKSTGV